MSRYSIIGLGQSGAAAIRYLQRSLTAKRLIVHDTRLWNELDARTQQLLHDDDATDISLQLGTYDLPQILASEAIVVSPGIAPAHPIVQAAKAQGIPLITEIELAAAELPKWVGITGTNGKSSITYWLAQLLNTRPCGNIGYPLSDYYLEQPDDAVYVCELSSYQLHYMHDVAPQIAIISNITPDHLSWHGGWQAYLAAKQRITTKQQADDWLLVPAKDILTDTPTQAQKLLVGTDQSSNCIYIQGQQAILRLHDGQQQVFTIADFPLPGWHNQQNLLFVLAAAYLAGYPAQQIQKSIGSLRALEHRLEYVGRKGQQFFYNDSKATNPEASMVALRSFAGQQIIWLAGGRDKNTPLADLKQVLKQAKNVSMIILFGEAQGRFYDQLQDIGIQMHCVQDLAGAVQLARRQANNEEQVVLLSPACASFDQFPSFEERGRCFKGLLRDTIESYAV